MATPGVIGFHESEDRQRRALCLMRGGCEMTKLEWERDLFPDGSRLAPVVDRLRNSWGFNISGDGSTKHPYHMMDPREEPRLTTTTEEMKAAYYSSDHWRNIRGARMMRDTWLCVHCGGPDPLQVHHARYLLFNEQISDLITVCEPCHEMIHESAKLKFPSGMSVVHVRMLGIDPAFPFWVRSLEACGEE